MQKNTQDQNRTGIKYPITILYAIKINMLKKLITRDRQPWMRWIESKLIKIADRWETEEAMASNPTKIQQRGLKDECLT